MCTCLCYLCTCIHVITLDNYAPPATRLVMLPLLRESCYINLFVGFYNIVVLFIRNSNVVGCAGAWVCLKFKTNLLCHTFKIFTVPYLQNIHCIIPSKYSLCHTFKIFTVSYLQNTHCAIPSKYSLHIQNSHCVIPSKGFKMVIVSYLQNIHCVIPSKYSLCHTFKILTVPYLQNIHYTFKIVIVLFLQRASKWSLCHTFKIPPIWRTISPAVYQKRAGFLKGTDDE